MVESFGNNIEQFQTKINWFVSLPKDKMKIIENTINAMNDGEINEINITECLQCYQEKQQLPNGLTKNVLGIGKKGEIQINLEEIINSKDNRYIRNIVSHEYLHTIKGPKKVFPPYNLGDGHNIVGCEGLNLYISGLPEGVGFSQFEEAICDAICVKKYPDYNSYDGIYASRTSFILKMMNQNNKFFDEKFAKNCLMKSDLEGFVKKIFNLKENDKNWMQYTQKLMNYFQTIRDITEKGSSLEYTNQFTDKIIQEIRSIRNKK